MKYKIYIGSQKTQNSQCNTKGQSWDTIATNLRITFSLQYLKQCGRTDT